ncbi:MAG: hypothetical protein ACFFAU_06530 [Candidatus Hodarchaeota archaeon]
MGFVKINNTTDKDDHSQSQEQPDFWFLGSLIRMKKQLDGGNLSKYYRIATIHNRITHEETNFDEKFQINYRIASQLSEFFPLKWLVEITASLRSIDANLIAIKSEEDRYAFYLGYIELYLAFRGLTLLESTLYEINSIYNLKFTMNSIRTWKMKLLRIIPGLLEQYKRIMIKTSQSSILNTVIHVMNHELVLNGCNKQEIFTVKQRALFLAKRFSKTRKARMTKKIEIWTQAICLKALKDVLPSHKLFPFPSQYDNMQKVLENKRWQLDKLLD